jgi:putative MFS transporter
MQTQLQTEDGLVTDGTRWMVTLAASFGWFFDAYVITIYALTVPLIAAEFHISTAMLGGVVGSIFLVGYTIGTIGFGLGGDMFGRKIMLGISIIGYGLVTALTALAGGIYSLATFRFLTGVGGGGELSIGSPYVTEVWARNRRSTGIGLMYSFYPLGYLFSVGVFALITPVWGWRAVYVFSLVPAAVIMLLRFRLEESPRFATLLSVLKQSQSKRVGLSQALRDPEYRRRLGVGFLIFSSLTYGYYAMAFYIPAYVVRTYHLQAAGGAAAVMALFTIGILVGGLLAGVLGDWIGRRLPAIVMAVFGIAIIYLWWGVQWSLAMFCIWGFLGGFLLGFEWTLGIVYVNELFPTEIRASGFGLSAGLGRIVSIAAPTVTQILSASLGVATAIQISAAIWLLLIVGYLISHETRGLELADRVTQSPNEALRVDPFAAKSPIA